MSSLELSKEMLSVEGYIADAKLIVEKQIGRHYQWEHQAHLLIEIAKMLQAERSLHKKTSPVKIPKDQGKDQVMSTARANPQVPLMVSSTPEEVRPKRSHTKKPPVAEVAKPARVRKPKPKVEPQVKPSRRR